MPFSQIVSLYGRELLGLFSSRLLEYSRSEMYDAFIADEVQVGFARSGIHFGGFGVRGGVPEIVIII